MEGGFILIAKVSLQVLVTPSPGDKKVDLKLANSTHAPRTMTTVMLVNERLSALEQEEVRKKSEQGRAIDIAVSITLIY